MRWNHSVALCPALVAGIHLLADLQQDVKAGTSPAMTQDNWFDMIGIRFGGSNREHALDSPAGACCDHRIDRYLVRQRL